MNTEALRRKKFHKALKQLLGLRVRIQHRPAQGQVGLKFRFRSPKNPRVCSQHGSVAGGLARHGMGRNCDFSRLYDDCVPVKAVTDMRIKIGFYPAGHVERNPAGQSFQNLITRVNRGNDVTDLTSLSDTVQQPGLHLGGEIIIFHQPIIGLIGKNANSTRYLTGQQMLIHEPHRCTFSLISKMNKIPFPTD